MALVAFTLVMTVFAIIEPLRKQGLIAEQVGTLIVYTLPVMLSLTLPIAALFATTIVYGRFSQDNELMACRASGISMRTLLKPAIVLGLVITAGSLLLSNLVTPSLAENAARAIKANVKAALFHKLRSEGYVSRGEIIIHASRADSDANVLEGVVAANVKDWADVRFGTAKRAQIYFRTVDDETYVSVHLDDPVGGRTGSSTVARGQKQPFPRELLLPNPIREDPAWYSWPRLFDTFENPMRNRDIQRHVADIRRGIGGRMLAQEVAAAIAAGEPYRKLGGEGKRLDLSAASAEVAGGEGVLHAGAGADGQRKPVLAVVSEPGRTILYEGDTAHVRCEYWELTRSFVVSVEFMGNARIMVLPGPDGEGAQEGGAWTEREVLKIGNLTLPDSVSQAVSRISLGDLCTNRTAYTSDPVVLGAIDRLVRHDLRKLKGRILGEMHGRVAYGVSCLLLVVMGAALGMVFRGGQVLSAFALSVVPATIVVVMVLMGQQMMGNPDVSYEAGLACIWAGIGLLVVGNAYIHLFLLRK